MASGSSSREISISIAEASSNGEAEFIFSVDSVMKENPTGAISVYLMPQVLSIGPAFFNPSHPVLREGNKIKDEAFLCIIRSLPGTHSASDVQSRVVLKILQKERDIKECYQGRFDLQGEAFAKMIVVDSCFLLVAFWLLSMDKDELQKFDEEIWPRLAIFKQKRGEEGEMQRFIQDLFKLENQLPFWLLEEVADEFEGWKPTREEISAKVNMAKVLHKLSPISVSFPCDLCGTLCYKKRGRATNLLHLLHQYVAQGHRLIGGPASLGIDKIIQEHTTRYFYGYGGNLMFKLFSIWKETTSLNAASSNSYFSHCLFLFTSFVSVMVALPVFLVIYSFILLLAVIYITTIYIPFFIIASVWEGPEEDKGAKLSPYCVPANVFVEKGLQGIKGTSFSKFRGFAGGRLKLPQIKIDETTQVLLWNLLLLERCSPKLDKTVTNYVCLMSEILQTRLACFQLWTADVLKGKRQERWTIQMWREMATYAKNLSGLDPLNPVCITVRKLAGSVKPSKLRVITLSAESWIEDLRTRYASNPWITLSTFAVLLLLLLTATQVFCLFHRCPGAAA